MVSEENLSNPTVLTVDRVHTWKQQQPSPRPLSGAQSGQDAYGGARALCLEGGTVTKSVTQLGPSED